MTSRQQRIQTLYEISLSIESRESLEATVDRALGAYLQKLNCSVGAVFRIINTENERKLSLVASIPATPDRNDLFQTARDRLHRLAETTGSQSGFSEIRSQASGRHEHRQAATGASAVDDPFDGQLPVADHVDDTSEYHLMELPEFGVLVLGKRGGTIEPETVAALAPLNEKLAQACQSNLTEQQLREQRDRFEAVFNAIPEPVVNVTIEDGTERIVRANEAFEETFVDDGMSIRSQDLNELIIPEGQSTNTAALLDALDRGKPMEKELQRETVTGNGHFLFSGVPVTASDQPEYFGVYVDITEQKEREQTLEELYDAAQDILDKQSRHRVCTHAIETIESVLGYSAVGIHLYQRDSEALEPIAVSDQIRERLDEGPAGYTDRETVLWKAYENHEPVRIDDTRQFDGKLPNEETPTRSAVILPIRRHGVLITSAFEPNEFDDRDVYFLRLLSQLVEIALDRTVNEEGLKSVQQAIRDALQAETHEEMAALVLDEIPEVLDLPVAGLWKYQPTTRQLQPIAQTAQATELVEDQPAFSKGNSIAWETFADGTTSVVPDVSERDDVHNPETPVKGEVTVPIGDFGVLIAASTYKDSFTQLDEEILEILATNIEVIAKVIDSRRDINLLDQVIARILRHNVRNKLTPILGYANTIAEEAEDPISQYAQKIGQNSKELERTTVHAREMREIVRGRDQMTTVSLGTTVRSAATSIEEKFPDCELITRIEGAVEVTAHPELGTAIRHLVRNGFEHNDSDTSRVEVIVEQGPDGPTVEISDNGSGIDPFEVEIIEEHGESALKHGSGVGLWIVDRVIEYSGAAIEFETTDGTTASITFGTPAANQAGQD